MGATSRKGLAWAFLAYASWGLLSPVGKRLLEDLEPLGLNAVRFAIAAIAVLAFLGPSQAREALRVFRRREVAWFNLLANGSLTLFLYSLVHLEPTYATLGFYSAPLWTAGLAGVVLRERVGPWFAPAVLLLLAGGYVALFGLRAPSTGVGAAGLALAVASAIVWAWYTVELRRHAPAIPLKPLMGASFLWGAAYFAAAALAVEGVPHIASLGAASWGWLALYVAVPTIASFVLFNAALQLVPAGQANILIAAELAFTALFAALLFGDRFTAAQVAGLAVALASVSGYLWIRERQANERPRREPGGP